MNDREEGDRGNAQSTYVSTAELTSMAVHNVQVVLAWCGYASEDVIVQAWSKSDGIRAIRHETRWLVVEFHESFYGTLRDGFVEVAFSPSIPAVS
jgi:hypothetical protein